MPNFYKLSTFLDVQASIKRLPVFADSWRPTEEYKIESLTVSKFTVSLI